MVNIKHPLYQEDLKYVAEYIRGSTMGVGEKKVLIMGATGLIGSFLTDVLVYYNRYINVQFDIWAMGRSLKRLQNRFSYVVEDEIHLWEHDINLPLNTDIEFDYIFHLASNADPAAYKSYPVETITTNVRGTLNILEYLDKHKESKVLFASTMEVYGESEGKRIKENDYGAMDFNCIRAGYPESKRVSELLYKSAIEQYGINAYIARMGYIYGPTMTDSDNKVVAQFLRDGMNRNDLELQSLGEQKRTYCYVADAVTGMIQIISSGESGEAYNVADM